VKSLVFKKARFLMQGSCGGLSVESLPGFPAFFVAGEHGMYVQVVATAQAVAVVMQIAINTKDTMTVRTSTVSNSPASLCAWRSHTGGGRYRQIFFPIIDECP